MLVLTAVSYKCTNSQCFNNLLTYAAATATAPHSCTILPPSLLPPITSSPYERFVEALNYITMHAPSSFLDRALLLKLLDVLPAQRLPTKRQADALAVLIRVLTPAPGAPPSDAPFCKLHPPLYPPVPQQLAAWLPALLANAESAFVQSERRWVPVVQLRALHNLRALLPWLSAELLAPLLVPSDAPHALPVLAAPPSFLDCREAALAVLLRLYEAGVGGTALENDLQEVVRRALLRALADPDGE
jgi:hypothetical protein